MLSGRLRTPTHRRGWLTLFGLFVSVDLVVGLILLRSFVLLNLRVLRIRTRSLIRRVIWLLRFTDVVVRLLLSATNR